MSGNLTSLGLQLRHSRHVLRGRPFSLRALAEPLDDRLILIVGCPRSGTTFLAGAISACPGLVDLGEVAALKAAIPRLTGVDEHTAAGEIRRILTLARRLGLVGRLRGVEQTPEVAFVVDAASAAFPEAAIVQILRDGRDVACSLTERGWLSRGRTGVDDAGQRYGSGARFWVEPERREEFEAASDVRRAAWAWRRYNEGVRAARAPVHEVRYERLASDPAAVAAELAPVIDVPPASLTATLGEVHDRSIGRYRRDLTPAELAEVEAEAGALLAELGYPV